MNALDKTEVIRILNAVWVEKMCRKEKGFQKNRGSVFHLRSKSNCSGVLVCLQVNMRQWCDVDAKENPTWTLTGSRIRNKVGRRGAEGGRRIRWSAYYSSEEWTTKRIKILGILSYEKEMTWAELGRVCHLQYMRVQRGDTFWGLQTTEQRIDGWMEITPA